MLSHLSPADAQRMLKMGPFSGSDMYIILSTESQTAFDAATFGFKGKIIQISKPGDVAALIDDKQPVLISNGDDLFNSRILLTEFLQDRLRNRHRNLVVIHRHGTYQMDAVLGNRFTHIRALPPVGDLKDD